MNIGKIFVIEGLDGSGKTTIINNFIFPNFKGVFLKDPYSSSMFCSIKDILFSNTIDPFAQMLMFYSCRTQIITSILDAIKSGKNVFLDRFYDSTVAYQGYGKGIDIEFIEYLNNYFYKNIDICYSILLDCSPEICIDRKNILKNDIDNLRKVRRGYINIFNNKKNAIILDNSHNDMEKIGKQVIDIIKLNI